MRKEFVAASTRKQAAKACPWASVMVKVQGGYKAFESWDDLKIWRAQR